MTLSPAQRILDASNYSTGKNFTIAITDDSEYEGTMMLTITHAATSNLGASSLFNGIQQCATISVTITDNDPPPPTATRTATRTSTRTPSRTPTAMPTSTATATPTPTATATDPLICTGGLSGGASESSGDTGVDSTPGGSTPCPPEQTQTAIALLTPTPTIGNCEIASTTLSDFGIAVPDNWINDPRPSILAGVQATGRALCLQGIGNGNIVTAFRTVMQGLSGGGAWRTIEFLQTSNAYCATTPTDDDTVIARIQCGTTDFTITEYTMAHELGHVFAIRVPDYEDAITIPEADGRLDDLEGDLVFGLRSYNVFIGGVLDRLEDWQRSDVVTDNGWGSAARWLQTPTPPSYDIYHFPTYTPPPPSSPTPNFTPFPVRIPRIGPCDSVRVPIEFPIVDAPPGNFQQNPCTYSNASDVWQPYDVEVEEAAADMFLNWVYWVNETGGFSDTDWRFQDNTPCYLQPAGCSDAGQSGQKRADWMSTQMATMLPPLDN